MNEKQEENEEPVTFTFPSQAIISVGDLVAIRTGYMFSGDIFNGHHTSSLYRFLGFYTKVYNADAPAYNRGGAPEMFIFEKYKYEKGYKYSAGILTVSPYYSRHDEPKTLRMEIGMDLRVHANTLEDLMISIGDKFSMQII